MQQWLQLLHLNLKLICPCLLKFLKRKLTLQYSGFLKTFYKVLAFVKINAHHVEWNICTSFTKPGTTYSFSSSWSLKKFKLIVEMRLQKTLTLMYSWISIKTNKQKNKGRNHFSYNICFECQTNIDLRFVFLLDFVFMFWLVGFVGVVVYS